MERTVVGLNDLQALNNYANIKNFIQDLESKKIELAFDLNFGDWCGDLNEDKDSVYFILACGAVHYFTCREINRDADAFCSIKEAIHSFRAAKDWNSYEECVFRIVRSINEPWILEFVWTLDSTEDNILFAMSSGLLMGIITEIYK